MHAKKLCTFLLFLGVYLAQNNKAQAFFAEDYYDNINRGVYRKDKTLDVYFNVQAGIFFKTWLANMNTIMLGEKGTSNYLNSHSGMPDQMTGKLKDKFNASASLAIGFHGSRSNWRHEIMFKWYYILSKPVGADGSSIDIDGTNYQYHNLSEYGGHYPTKFGMWADVYKIMYNLFYDFQHAFKFMDITWDIYLGGGVGIAIIDGGLYKSAELIKDDKGTFSYQENTITTSINAKKYDMYRHITFGLGFQISAGLTANISQSFAGTVGLIFEGTSRPLLDVKMKKPDGFFGGESSLLEYHIALQVGILLKATSIA